MTNNHGSYTLTVPDWVEGPSDIAALEMPNRDHRPAASRRLTANIYVFAVPIDASCTVASVTLPDVSASVRPTVASGVSQAQPALHIFGHGAAQQHDSDPPGGRLLDGGTGDQEGLDRIAPGAWLGTGPTGRRPRTAWNNQTIRVVRT